MSGCCGISYELMQRQEISVRREFKVNWSEGLPYAMDVKTFCFRGVMFPITGKELLLVPEGDRFRQNIWVFTQGDLRDNDLVTFCNNPYEVQTVEEWGSFKRARAMRMDVGPDGDQ